MILCPICIGFSPCVWVPWATGAGDEGAGDKGETGAEDDRRSHQWDDSVRG